VFVLLLPKGLVPTARDLLLRLAPAPRTKAQSTDDALHSPAAPPHPAGAE